jgi:hypothetical protein
MGKRVIVTQSVLAVCRPVDWSALAELAPDVPETPVYPGSVKGVCEICKKVEIWIGPRAHKTKQDNERVVICCFLCGIKASAEAAGDTVVGNLGNTYLPRKRGEAT